MTATKHPELDEDLYGLLGVGPDATTREIEKAYRARARTVHPDKKQGPDAAKMFVRLHRAKEVLCDTAALKAYDEVMRARLERKRHEAAMTSERRRMTESLAAREAAAAAAAAASGATTTPKTPTVKEERELQHRLEEEIERLRAEGHLDPLDVSPPPSPSPPPRPRQQPASTATKRSFEELERDVLGKMLEAAKRKKQQQ